MSRVFTSKETLNKALPPSGGSEKAEGNQHFHNNRFQLYIEEKKCYDGQGGNDTGGDAAEYKTEEYEEGIGRKKPEMKEGE